MNIIQKLNFKIINGYTDEQIQMLESGYTTDQINEIEHGKESDINYQLYSDKENSATWMKVVREALENNLVGLEKYYINGEKQSNFEAEDLKQLSHFFEQAKYDDVDANIIDYFSEDIAAAHIDHAQYIYDECKKYKNLETLFKQHEDNIFNELQELNNNTENNASTFILKSSIEAECLLKLEDVVELTINAEERLVATEDEINICLPYNKEIATTLLRDFDDLSHVVVKSEITKEKYFENSIVRELLAANNFLNEHKESDYTTIKSIEKVQLMLDEDTANKVIENAKNTFLETFESHSSPEIRFPNQNDSFEFSPESAFVVRNNSFKKMNSIDL